MFSQINRVRQLTQVSGPKRAPNGNVKDSERLTRLPKFSVDSELNYQRVAGFGECHRSVKPSDTRVLQVPADVLRGTVSHATRRTPALLSLATSQSDASSRKSSRPLPRDKLICAQPRLSSCSSFSASALSA